LWLAERDVFSLKNFYLEKFTEPKIVSHVRGCFLSDLCVSAVVNFCHNFNVKLFSDKNPRVYCLGHLEVIFIYEIRCVKIDNL
jgi:hypothetical protein